MKIQIILKRFIFICILGSFSIITGCDSSDGDEMMNGNGTDVTANRQKVGESANDLLSAQNYPKLIVEIQYIEGFAPTSQTISNLKTFLEQRLNKPDGIVIIDAAITVQATKPYSLEEISEIENQNRTQYNSSDQIAAYYFFADGGFEDDTDQSKTLGIAYWNTSMVIFEKTIQDLSNDPLEPAREVLETTVTTHEFGHILGLVNNGTPMLTDHQDEAHGPHCDVEDCLMNWQAEASQNIGNLIGGGGSPAQLDLQCLDDLQANGGK